MRWPLRVRCHRKIFHVRYLILMSSCEQHYTVTTAYNDNIRLCLEKHLLSPSWHTQQLRTINLLQVLAF